MNRSVEQRVAAIRRLVSAAAFVHRRRAALASAIAASTGLTAEGVELGFESLEQDAPDDALRSIVESVAETDHVHVVLASNVFVAPLRALVLARAAAERVTVRPSKHDPVLARELVAEAGDPAIALVEERDVAAFGSAEIHVYGRDSTIRDVVRRAHPSAIVRGYGTGMGIALVTRAAPVGEAAAAAVGDVVRFDQRGCLSPRVVLVEGDVERAESFARALHEQLEDWERRVPRGSIDEAERAEATSWRGSATFSGRIWWGRAHGVALTLDGRFVVPPAGRHVQVAAWSTLAELTERVRPVEPFVVVAGSDDPAAAVGAMPWVPRVALLGRMQLPLLDGPIDRRRAKRWSVPVVSS